MENLLLTCMHDTDGFAFPSPYCSTSPRPRRSPLRRYTAVFISHVDSSITAIELEDEGVVNTVRAAVETTTKYKRSPGCARPLQVHAVTPEEITRTALQGAESTIESPEVAIQSSDISQLSSRLTSASTEAATQVLTLRSSTSGEGSPLQMHPALGRP